MDDSTKQPAPLSERMRRYVDSIDLEIEVAALESQLAEAEARAEKAEASAQTSVAECGICEHDFDTEIEQAVCWGCYGSATLLVDDLLEAIDPRLAAEADEDDVTFSRLKMIAIWAAEQVEMQRSELAAAQAREAKLRAALDAAHDTLVQSVVDLDDPHPARQSPEVRLHIAGEVSARLGAAAKAAEVALSDAPPAAEPTPDPSDDDASLALVQDLAKAGLRYELNPTQYLGPDADRSRAWWQERFGQADQDIRSRAREALRACGWKIDAPPPSLAPCCGQPDSAHDLTSPTCPPNPPGIPDGSTEIDAAFRCFTAYRDAGHHGQEREAFKSAVAAMLRSMPGRPAMHLPAQMEELRGKLEALKAAVLSMPESVHCSRRMTADRIDEILRLVPVQHDDNMQAVEVKP